MVLQHCGVDVNFLEAFLRRVARDQAVGGVLVLAVPPEEMQLTCGAHRQAAVGIWKPLAIPKLIRKTPAWRRLFERFSNMQLPRVGLLVLCLVPLARIAPVFCCYT